MECFGDSSDEDEDIDDQTSATAIKRDESCGVCSFHSNTEVSLLAHVRNALSSKSNDNNGGTPPSSSSPEKNEQEDIRRALRTRRSGDVLRAIDEYCTSRHWMMHVGPEKGDILVGALREAMENKVKSKSRQRCLATTDTGTGRSPAKFVAVELGTYCGYASILMGQAMCSETSSLECHLYSMEINREYAEVSAAMIKLSGMQDVISVHTVSYDGNDTDLTKVVGNALMGDNDDDGNSQNGGSDGIDFLFIDHDKDAYLPDLQRLESCGMIRAGTRVVADNVLFAQIDDYLRYVRQLKEEGTVVTKTIECRVEYSGDDGSGGGGGGGDGVQPYKDGVEITDYLKDPKV